MPNESYLESRIGVMETKWFEHRNTSVRELFNLLSELKYEHHHAYRYEMFGGKEEFSQTFNRLSQKNGIHYIYVAAHGDESNIAGSMGEIISKKRILSAISRADEQSGRLAGLYFGSCSFDHKENMESLLTKGTKLRWIAGYTKDVDFVKSAAFDLLFFNTLLSYRQDNELSELEAILRTAENLNQEASGLMSNLGFSLYVWNQNDAKKLIGP